jgi:hypothetical protein
MHRPYVYAFKRWTKQKHDDQQYNPYDANQPSEQLSVHIASALVFEKHCMPHRKFSSGMSRMNPEPSERMRGGFSPALPSPPPRSLAARVSGCAANRWEVGARRCGGRSKHSSGPLYAERRVCGCGFSKRWSRWSRAPLHRAPIAVLNASGEKARGLLIAN